MPAPAGAAKRALSAAAAVADLSGSATRTALDMASPPLAGGLHAAQAPTPAWPGTRPIAVPPAVQARDDYADLLTPVRYRQDPAMPGILAPGSAPPGLGTPRFGPIRFSTARFCAARITGSGAGAARPGRTRALAAGAGNAGRARGRERAAADCRGCHSPGCARPAARYRRDEPLAGQAPVQAGAAAQRPGLGDRLLPARRRTLGAQLPVAGSDGLAVRCGCRGPGVCWPPVRRSCRRSAATQSARSSPATASGRAREPAAGRSAASTGGSPGRYRRRSSDRSG